MVRPWVNMKFSRNAGLQQPGRILHVLIPNGIELTHLKETWRQTIKG